MCTKYEKGSRRHQFVSEEMSKDELKEKAPIRGISNSTIDVDKRKPSSNNERKKGRKKEVSRALASDIAYDNHRFPLRECDGYSVEKITAYLQHTTVCTNTSSVAVDTAAIQDSELLRRAEDSSSCRSSGNGSYEPNAKDHGVNLRSKLVWTIAYRARGRPLYFRSFGCVYNVCQIVYFEGSQCRGFAYTYD